ncbi:hypothetical protein ACJW30_03G053400 [Castanea mollissima]
MSSSSTSSSVADLPPLPQLPHNLRKSFKLLKTHAAAVANFTLQWQDLEDHFHSIHNSIQSKLQEFQSQQKTHLDSKETILIPAHESQVNSKETQLSPALESQEKSEETQFSNQQDQADTEGTLPENNGNSYEIPINEGWKAVLLYLNDHSKEHESMHKDLYNALKDYVDPGKLVFEAVKWSHLQELEKGNTDKEIRVSRWSCALLLEELLRVKPVVKAEVREEVLKLALELKRNIKEDDIENSWEVLGFLLLVGAFGLVAEFDEDEVLELLKYSLHRKETPELVRALGFANRALGPLLKAHLKHSKKKIWRSISRNYGSIQPDQKNEMANREIAVLKAMLRCIDKYNLGSHYDPRNLVNRIELLKRQNQERKAMKAASKSKAQVQQKITNKCTANYHKAGRDQQSRFKRPQTDESCASVNAAFSIHSVQPSYPQREGFFVGQGAECLNPPAGMAVAAAIPNVSVGTIHSRQLTHYQPESSFTAQDSQFLTPSAGPYGLACSSPDPTRVSLSGAPYGFPYSSPVPQYANSSVGCYGMVGSQTGTPWSSSSGQYGTNIIANGSTEQIGSAGTQTAVGIASNSHPDRSISYYPGNRLRSPNYHDDRSVSQTHNRDKQSQCPPPAIYHL